MKLRIALVICLAAMFTLGLAGTSFAALGVVGSAHDLSDPASNDYGTGGNGINQVCVFCHTPHNAASDQENTAGGLAPSGFTGGDVPLWSHQINQTANIYKPYESATVNAGVALGQPGPVSLACLGCHDGTIAVGEVQWGQKSDKGPDSTKPGMYATVAHDRADRSYGVGQTMGDFTSGGLKIDPNLTTDLRNDHPVGIQYVVAHNMNAMPINDYSSAVKLFGAGKNMVECASCHEPHSMGNITNMDVADFSAAGKIKVFLRSTMKASALCLTCHNK